MILSLLLLLSCEQRFARYLPQDLFKAFLDLPLRFTKTGLIFCTFPEVESGHSSFLAQFSALQATTPTSGPFRFDHVVFDDGNGYDPLLGVFTAPFTGVYVISAKFYTRGSQPSHPIIDFKLNGNILDRMGFDITAGTSGHEDSSRSSTFAVRLQAGDKVWLESIGGRAFNLFGRYHSYFSGALISAQWQLRGETDCAWGVAVFIYRRLTVVFCLSERRLLWKFAHFRHCHIKLGCCVYLLIFVCLFVILLLLFYILF